MGLVQKGLHPPPPRQTRQTNYTQKLTNFGAVSIVEPVVWGKGDGNIKDAPGQA